MADAVCVAGASFANYPGFLNLHLHPPQFMVPDGAVLSWWRFFLLQGVFLGSGWRILEAQRVMNADPISLS